jgi:putative acyl-CoA dehydrogenase
MDQHNQPPPLTDYNLFTSDPVLENALDGEGAGWARAAAVELGRVLGTEETIRLGFEANENPPVLGSEDQVDFHASWHALMKLSVENRLHSLPWHDARPGAHVARAALMFLASQNEAGHTCPISMTYASIAALRKEPEVAAEWEPRIVSSTYDPRFRPAAEKNGVLIGMSMTERQGGSDVRANTTLAEPISNGEYRITGAKWFCSAPMNDAFLILAQAPRGLTCFLLPRWTPDGKRNAFHIERLKPKLGNRSNASAEIEFDRAWAHRIGEEGRGVRTIMEMVQHTRLDCMIGSAALMRQAVLQALYHAQRRKAFGKLLIDQPLMRNVLADLSLESQAATLLMMRLARAVDAKASDDTEQAFARFATPVGKYWICKRGPSVVVEAMECLGGNGYVDDCVMPRLHREAPVNSIWEGCGNVICLDILRAMKKDPAIPQSVMHEARLARSADRRFDAFLRAVEADLPKADEYTARVTAERLALALQASLMIRHASAAAADAFCATRLAGGGGHAFGTLPGSVDATALLETETAVAR